jgi:hypothetical protein
LEELSSSLTYSTIKKGFSKTWNQILIIPNFKRESKINPSNYLTIMNSPLLANSYEIILKKKINRWIKSMERELNTILELVSITPNNLIRLGLLWRVAIIK